MKHGGRTRGLSVRTPREETPVRRTGGAGPARSGPDHRRERQPPTKPMKRLHMRFEEERTSKSWRISLRQLRNRSI